MTRAELKAALVARLGIPPVGDNLITVAAQTEVLNLALSDMSMVREWPWLLTSATLSFTAGVAPIPATAISFRELVINGRRARKASSLPEFLDCLADGTRNLWYRDGTNIKLAPVPATAPTSNTLYFLQNEPALTSDGQSPLMPAQYHNLVVARAAYHANLRRNRLEMAAQDNGEYEAGLKRMASAASSLTGQRAVRHVGVSRWAVWG